MENNSEETPSHFIKSIIAADLQSGKVDQVLTRFPPEPNGYLHIGHAKAICINFELAKEFGGKTNLRFDDTNPVKEDVEYVEAIKEDIRWLGFQWENLHFASDYFEIMVEKANFLIEKGKAYVCDLSAEDMRATRGTLTQPGQESPYRNRTVAENLDLFKRMREGEFADGTRVLRSKIDMSSPNMNMRDPVLYRILQASHHRTGNDWCIYPMYDYAHPMGDAIEGVTHSLCSLEYEDHRPLYDWVIRECEMESEPKQYEFARLNLTHTVTSKRNLKPLVDEGVVDGWDDPRMPTLCGLRRKGVTPEAIRRFAREIGVSKSNSTVDARFLDHFIREDLKLSAPRTMAVLKPLKVVITNYPEGKSELLEAENNSENEELGHRQISFSREIYIEQDDFIENPPPKYFRLFPGNEVRLKNAYFIKCEEFIKDEQGNVVELRCTYDPETKSGSGFTGRKVKGTIHWVDANNAVPAEFRLYDSLFLEGDEKAEEAVDGEVLAEAQVAEATEEKDAANQNNAAKDRAKSYIDLFNPQSLETLHGYVESNMKGAKAQDKFQLFRHGYFNVDSKNAAITPDQLVFNRIVSLKSSFGM